MELTRAEINYAVMLLKAKNIVGFEHLFPTDVEEKQALLEAGHIQVEKNGVLKKKENGYDFDPIWLYRITVAVFPETALITQNTDIQTKQVVGSYFAGDFAVELVQTSAEQVNIRALSSPNLALTRIVSAVEAISPTGQITAYHAAGNSWVKKAEWQAPDDISIQVLKDLLA